MSLYGAAIFRKGFATMQTIKDWYLGGMVPTQDDAEFERKHPRKGGKFAKKGEGGGVPTKSEELKADIQYAKKWIADAKAGKFTASKELIKRNEKYLDGLVRLNDFIDLHGTEVKNGADYSRRIEFLMQNRQHLEIDSIASVMADARIGKFGNFILYPSAKNGAAANVAAHCESLGLGVKKTAKGNIQVFMKDAPKETVGQKKDDGAKAKGFDVSADSLKEKVKTMPKLSDGVEVSVEGKGGKVSVAVTFNGALSEEDTKKIADHLGVDLMQKEYDNSGWVVYDAYAKDSVPSFMMIDQYRSRDEVALAVADRPALAKVAPMTPEESVAYYQSVGRNARIGEKDGKKGIFTSIDLGDGKTSQEEFCSTQYATDFMHNHILRNKKYGFPVKFAVPKRWSDAIAKTSLYKKYSGESK